MQPGLAHALPRCAYGCMKVACGEGNCKKKLPMPAAGGQSINHDAARVSLSSWRIEAGNMEIRSCFSIIKTSLLKSLNNLIRCHPACSENFPSQIENRWFPRQTHAYWAMQHVIAVHRQESQGEPESSSERRNARMCTPAHDGKCFLPDAGGRFGAHCATIRCAISRTRDAQFRHGKGEGRPAYVKSGAERLRQYHRANSRPGRKTDLAA